MADVLLIFALRCEAEATLELLNAKEISKDCFLFSNGRIVLSGIGIMPALVATSRYVHQIREIWNFGLAGALNNSYRLGTLCNVETVGKFTHLPENIDSLSKEISEKISPEISLQKNKGAKLISSDFPIHDEAIKQQLNHAWDLVDMEGYGIAMVAEHFNIPCKLWKIVSDFATPDGRALIKKNMPLLSELLAKEVAKNLSFGFISPEIQRDFCSDLKILGRRR